MTKLTISAGRASARRRTAAEIALASEGERMANRRDKESRLRKGIILGMEGRAEHLIVWSTQTQKTPGTGLWCGFAAAKRQVPIQSPSWLM